MVMIMFQAPHHSLAQSDSLLCFTEHVVLFSFLFFRTLSEQTAQPIIAKPHHKMFV